MCLCISVFVYLPMCAYTFWHFIGRMSKTGCSWGGELGRWGIVFRVAFHSTLLYHLHFDDSDIEYIMHIQVFSLKIEF